MAARRPYGGRAGVPGREDQLQTAMKWDAGTTSFRHRVTVVLTMMAVAGVMIESPVIAQSDPGELISTPSHHFQEMAPGVFFATGSSNIVVHSNSMVVIRDSDVLIVDSHVSPAAARALVDSVRILTDKPIGVVVNTHYHFDHTSGNQIFGEGVTIIGHEFTRSKLSGEPLKEATYIGWNRMLLSRLAEREAIWAEMSEGAEKNALAEQVRVQKTHIAAMAEMRPTPPNMTLVRKLTLYRGGRIIELHHLGRGHTGGDVVVFLPEERLVYTGDLIEESGASYLGDGYVDEWVDTLDCLKELDFDWILPGHGEPFQTRTKIDAFQAVLRNLWREVSFARKSGQSSVDVAASLDMDRIFYPMGRNPFATMGGSAAGLVKQRVVDRIYEVIDEQDIDE